LSTGLVSILISGFGMNIGFLERMSFLTPSMFLKGLIISLETGF
jgi:hypothetical protein